MMSGKETPQLMVYDRIKDKLKSGEMLVRGDQWPIFLYAESSYDPEDPWKGLLRSSLLICASYIHYSSFDVESLCFVRHTNIYLHPRAQSTKNRKPPDQAMLASME